MKLIIEDDEGRKTVVPIVREEMEITIGRQEGNTIRLTERNVSRKHAKIVRKSGSVFVEDIGSSYGTRVNGDKIDGRFQVKEGDLIQIGDYDLAVQYEGKEVAANGASAPAKAAPAPAPAPASDDASEPDSDQVTAEHEAPASAPKHESTAVISGAQLKALRASRDVVDVPVEEAPRLVLVNTDNVGREYACIRSEIKIGRTDENDVAIDHRSLSRTHCKVIRGEGNEWRVLDMQSANGVKVNGETYAESLLKPGDFLELGHVKFKFVGPNDEVGALTDTTSGATIKMDSVVAAGGKSKKGLVIGGAVGALALLGGGGAFFLMKGKPVEQPPKVVKGPDTTPEKQPATTRTPDKQPDQVVAKTPDEPKTPDKTPEPTVDPKAQKALDAGKALLADGKFPEAEKELAKAAGAPGADAALTEARAGIEATKKVAEAKKKLSARDYEGAKAALASADGVDALAGQVSALRDQITAAEEKDAQSASATAAAEEKKRQAEEAKKAADEEKRARLEEEKRKKDEERKKAAEAKTSPQVKQTSGGADKAQAAEAMATGRDLLKKQKHKEAATFFEKVLVADPTMAEAHMFLGSCYATMGDMGKAAEHYKKFVTMRPDAPQAPMIRENLKRYNEQHGGE